MALVGLDLQNLSFKNIIVSEGVDTPRISFKSLHLMDAGKICIYISRACRSCLPIPSMQNFQTKSVVWESTYSQICCLLPYIRLVSGVNGCLQVLQLFWKFYLALQICGFDIHYPSIDDGLCVSVSGAHENK